MPLRETDSAGVDAAAAEAAAMRERYDRRADVADRYDPLRPEVMRMSQERARVLARMLTRRLGRVRDRRVLEIGCGIGNNLLELVQLGFSPTLLVGNELLPERAARARERLPAAVGVVEGDALALPFPDGSFDVVYQSTVFSSILDADVRGALAARMWSWVRPGGGVLWYDFVLDNPSNPDVRGVRDAEVRALFPAGRAEARRVTLAPPLARAAARVHPALYTCLNTIPWLRTHRLYWIAKS